MVVCLAANDTSGPKDRSVSLDPLLTEQTPVRGRVAHIGLVLGTTSAPDAPHRTPVGPKLEPTGLSSAEVTPQVGPKWAPVRPNLWPRTAAFDPSQLLVGPSRPASLLSVKFPGCGRFSSRSDIYIYICTYNTHISDNHNIP